MKRFVDTRRRILLGIGGMAGTLAIQTARAQTDPWPSKPIRFVVPSAAGGAADFVGRTFGALLAKKVHQPVVIENKPGAAAIIGAETVKNAEADGYTFLVSGSSTQAANVSLFKRLPTIPPRTSWKSASSACSRTLRSSSLIVPCGVSATSSVGQRRRRAK